MSRSRKHGVFAVSSELIVLPIKNHEMKRDSLNIISANEDYRKLSETIESYQYIFDQFVTINKIRYAFVHSLFLSLI